VKKSIETQFRNIADTTIRAAGIVQCLKPEYIEGLLLIRDEVNCYIEAAQEEIAGETSDSEDAE